MAYQTHTLAPGASGLGHLALQAEALVERFSNFLAFRRTLRELSALDDAELADIGMNRSNLRSAAYEATYGVR